VLSIGDRLVYVFNVLNVGDRRINVDVWMFIYRKLHKYGFFLSIQQLLSEND